MTDTSTETTPTEPAGRRTYGRRGFFAVAGAVGAGAVLVACGDDDTSDTGSGTDGDGGTDGGTANTKDNDVAIATFGAGLELLAANTYKAALDAAGAGSLGDVPPAVAEFATVAMAHHQEASDALATAAGGITPTVPPDIEASVNDAFGKVTDVTGLAELALDLETKAAATYLEVLPLLQSPDAINLVGSILPIERQHAAVLLFVLGKYPVPDTFATTDASLAPAL